MPLRSCCEWVKAKIVDCFQLRQLGSSVDGHCNAAGAMLNELCWFARFIFCARVLRMKVLAGLAVLGFLGTQGVLAQESPSRSMAGTVVSAMSHPGEWKDEGMLLDGVAAEWHTTADGQDFHYIQAAVDKYLAANDGKAHDVEMGKPI